MNSDYLSGEPTGAEPRDVELAKQIAVAFLANVPYLYSSIAGVLAGVAAPILLAVANSAAVQRLGRRRAEHAAEMMLDAAEAADLPLNEFLDKAVSDDRRQELLSRALGIAQDTALKAKRRVLSRALANGVMGDEAHINEELLFMRAVQDIDEMHIRLLSRLANPPGSRWDADSIVRADPGLEVGVVSLLRTLEVHGLVRAHMSVPPGGAVRSLDPDYSIAALGERLLARLGDESRGQASS